MVRHSAVGAHRSRSSEGWRLTHISVCLWATLQPFAVPPGIGIDCTARLLHLQLVDRTKALPQEEGH